MSQAQFRLRASAAGLVALVMGCDASVEHLPTPGRNGYSVHVPQALL